MTISTFSGGMINSGMIAAAMNGIWVGGNASVPGGGLNAASVTVLDFAGGIANTGTISAVGNGVWVGGNASISAGFSNAASMTVSTFTGGITNSGAISAGGNAIWVGGNASISGGSTNVAAVTISTFAGGIANSGTISAGGAGIFVGGNANISGGGSNNTASVTISTFSGGISNAGMVTAAASGIAVGYVSTFAGGISNSGTVAAREGIAAFDFSIFSGGVGNSGTISAADAGIVIVDASTFAGGISNSGTISAARYGIIFSNVNQFSSSNGGGISNSGTISAAGFVGVYVIEISSFAGNISNSGTISAGVTGIEVWDGSTFAGDISNSGTISAGDYGIRVLEYTSFAGGISNSGKITANTGIAIGSGVTFAAGSAIVNSGTITGTGGTAINLASATTPVTVDITGGTIVGNMAGAGIASGDTLNFTLGDGTFTYNSSFTNFDTVNVNSGMVVLNGASNSAAMVNVNSGGTLAGNGTIDPPMANGVMINSGGTLEPGTPGTAGGTLTITGGLTFTSGADYEIQLTPTAHTSATVSGNLALGGGTVELAPLTLGHYSATMFPILTYGGTLTGTFNPTVVYAGTIQLATTPTISYVPFNVDLSYGNTYADLATPAGANQNQQAVINGINNGILAGDTIPAGFQQLAGLSGAALLNAYSQLDGEDATGAEKSAFQLMQDFLNLLTDPAGGGGSGTGAGTSPTQFAPEQDASLPPDIALAYAHALHQKPPASSQPQDFDQRWSAWAAGFGGSGTADGNATVGSSNVTATDYGYAAGMTYHPTPGTDYGFALAGGGTNWNLTQSLGSGRSDSFQAGVYGTTHFGPAYLSGALAFANHWFTTNRIALGDDLTANFQGQSYAARGEAGYRYAVPLTGYIIGVTPCAALQVQDFHTPGYSETDLTGGGFGLTYASVNATDTRSELGARFDNLTMWDGMPLVLRGRLAWAHDWVSNPALGAVFQTLPGANFTVNGAAPPKNSALTTAAAELHLTANWTAMAKFDGAFGSGSQTYAGTGTLRYTW
ncbi:MAG: autotransporter domain-containing protein [Xanthobacteraceae bacterium]